jgi:hypothetical protein
MDRKVGYIVSESSAGAAEVTVEKTKTTYKMTPQLDSWSINEGLFALGEKIDILNSNIEHLIRLMNPPVQQLLIEPMAFDQAKEVVSSYMRDHRTASISELAEQLQIDLRMLCKVIEELSKEGHIKERE